MCRNGAFALVVLIGSAAWSQAQPYRGGWPPPPPAGDIRGAWYADGDPNLPCYVEVGRDGYRAFFTNENGDRSSGRILGRGRVVADKWRLPGQVQGDVIEWANGSHWTR
jgi:hypothetical protein